MCQRSIKSVLCSRRLCTNVTSRASDVLGVAPKCVTLFTQRHDEIFIETFEAGAFENQDYSTLFRMEFKAEDTFSAGATRHTGKKRLMHSSQ